MNVIFPITARGMNTVISFDDHFSMF